jgi:DnaJ-class molecular chaperone
MVECQLCKGEGRYHANDCSPCNGEGRVSKDFDRRHNWRKYR